MRQLAIVLTPCLLLLGLACAPDPDEPNAFMTYTSTTYQTSAETTADTADTNVPPDMSSAGDGDGTPGDGDGSPTTTNTTNPTTTNTTGDGDGDPTTGGAVCGNGIIDDGEQCDGGNLGGFTCTDLGYSGGTLACDPVTCTYDASACVNNSTTTSGGTSG